ncbi:MAG: hypothetical protein ACLGHN_12710 [Bacteriovoracia bacterium]
MKALIITIITLFSQITFANNWKHIYHQNDQYSIRLSYTSSYLPATYGSNGGVIAGLFYIDVYSAQAFRSDRVEIFEIQPEGRLYKVTQFNMIENHGRHAFGQKPKGRTYGDEIWKRRSYLYQIYVDGRIVEGIFKI